MDIAWGIPVLIWWAIKEELPRGIPRETFGGIIESVLKVMPEELRRRVLCDISGRTSGGIFGVTLVEVPAGICAWTPTKNFLDKS